MNRTVGSVLIVVLLLLSGFFGYRAYRSSMDRDILARQAEAARADAERLKAEADRRVAAETEARRLAELKSQQDAQQNEERLAKLRADEAAAEAARYAAAEAARQESEQLARVRREKETAEAESRRLAAMRDKDAAEAEAARADALRRIEEIERLKRQQADRDAALAAQKAREAQWHPGPMMDRMLFTPDFKGRQHYYQGVFMFNAESQRPPAPLKPRTSFRPPLRGPCDFPWMRIDEDDYGLRLAHPSF